jgi:hypothetical protein
MFGDENNLYLENLLTGTKYRFILIKTDISEGTLNVDDAVHLEQEIKDLQTENELLKQRIEFLEMTMIQG